MSKPTKKNPKTKFAMQLLELAPFDLVRVLRPLGEAIAEVDSYLDKLSGKQGASDWVDAVVDDECDVIEQLLGSSFIACQTYITAVVSRVKRMHKLEPKLITTDNTKKSILAAGFRPTAKHPYSDIAVIDAYANYYKHRTEWHGSWSKLDAQSKKTAAVITAAGAEEGSTGNLRRGSTYLGNKGFIQVERFDDILQAWRKNLVTTYRKEIEALS